MALLPRQQRRHVHVIDKRQLLARLIVDREHAIELRTKGLCLDGDAPARVRDDRKPQALDLAWLVEPPIDGQRRGDVEGGTVAWRSQPYPLR